MSNKTTLQSHNERIQGLIDTANALPDTGISQETYTGIIYSSPKGDLAEMNRGVYYTNANGEFVRGELISEYSDVASLNITVLKNTIIACVDKVDGYTGVEDIDVNYGNEKVHRPTQNGFTISVRQ